MAKLVSPPKPRRVKCNDCGATIEFFTEELQTIVTDYTGGTDEAVKCPREGCVGWGIPR